MRKKNISTGPESDQTSDDIREALYNSREQDPAKQIVVSLAEITVLHGFFIDLDLKHFDAQLRALGHPETPESLFSHIVQPWLSHCDILDAAEVRMSGGGLHIIILFSDPVTFEVDTKRTKWRQIVRLVQRLLPSDPQQPDIIALTRPVGAMNSKAGRAVLSLRLGRPVDPEAVEALAKRAAESPFQTLAGVLFGTDRVSPCPFCVKDNSELVADKYVGRCYECGNKKCSDAYQKALGSVAGSANHSKNLVKQFERSAQELGWSLLPGDDRRPRIHGVTPRGEFTEPVEVVLAKAAAVLRQSPMVYRMGLDVFLEVTEASGRQKLERLTACGVLRPQSHLLLTTLFVCSLGHDHALEFSPPRDFVVLLLRHAFSSLREVCLYVSRPVYALDFTYCDCGYEPNAGVLVHGPRVLPKELGSTPNFEEDCPHLATVLRDFPFRTLGDRANAIALVLTGFNSQHFVSTGKPVGILDGNQANVGKTLFAHCLSMLLDGLSARTVRFTTNEEELTKCLGATLGEPTPFTVVLFDNCKLAPKEVVSSATIEALSTSPEIRIRILQTSSNLILENNRLWVITMNNTRTSPDLMSRSLPIQLHYEGNPRRRSYDGRDPLKYCTQHRGEILSEIAGMIHRWIRVGMPRVPSCHRCAAWSSMIGGILEANGIAGFLNNFDAVAAEFDAGIELLTDMAQQLWNYHRTSVASEPGDQRSSVFDSRGADRTGEAAPRSRYGMTVGEINRTLDSWLRRQREKSRCPFGDSDRDLGLWLSSMLQREVSVLTENGLLSYVLHRRQARNQSYYWFCIVATGHADVVDES